MPPPTIPSPWTRWSVTKKYIVAALLGALAVIAIVAGISISLAPPHICFSIKNAKYFAKGDCFNFTLVANNTSRRTVEVKYSSLNAEISITPTERFQTVVNMTKELPGWQGPTTNPTYVPVSIESSQYEQTDNTAPTMEEEEEEEEFSLLDCKVVLEAKVRFEIRRCRTRMFTVRATCLQVNFYNATADVIVYCEMY